MPQDEVLCACRCADRVCLNEAHPRNGAPERSRRKERPRHGKPPQIICCDRPHPHTFAKARRFQEAPLPVQALIGTRRGLNGLTPAELIGVESEFFDTSSAVRWSVEPARPFKKFRFGPYAVCRSLELRSRGPSSF